MPRCRLREVQYLKIAFFILWKYFGKWCEAKCLMCNDFSLEPVNFFFLYKLITSHGIRYPMESVSFTSRAKGCIKFLPHSCLVSLSHEVGVFLEEAICYFIYAKFAVMSLKVVHQYGCFESCQFRPHSFFFVS